MYTAHCLKVLIFILFVLAALGVTVQKLVSSDEDSAALIKREKKSSQSSHFSEVQFFSTKEGKPHLKLQATETEWDPVLGIQVHENPRGIIFNQNNQQMHYVADSGLVNEKNSREILLKSKVELTTEDSLITAEQMEYKFDSGFYSASGNVYSEHLPASGREKILVNSQKLEYRHNRKTAIYSGQVTGKVRRNRAYEQGLDFSASAMVVDLNKSHVELKNDVSLKKQRLKASALHGEIFLENYNKKLKYYRLYDDVKVNESLILKNGKRIKRKAFAEKLEGFNQTDRIVLTGSPKVIQDKEIIKGNKISLTQNNEIIEVDDANSKFIIRDKSEP